MAVKENPSFWAEFIRALLPGIQYALIYLAGVLSTNLPKWLKGEKALAAHESVGQTFDFNLKMAVATERCLELLGPTAMRVYYTKFHNGDYFDDGSPMQKKSRFCEALRPGVAPLPERYASNILVSKAMDEIKLIRESGPSFTAICDLPKAGFRWTCEEFGVQAVARVAVYRGKPYPQNLIGFVGADFDGDNANHPPRPPEPEHLVEMQLLSEKIGQLSMNYKGEKQI